MDRGALVLQIGKAFAGEEQNPLGPPLASDEELRRRAEEALARVERYLGVDIEEAKDIVTRVIQDPS